MRRKTRSYDHILRRHLDRYRQMIFVSGPRQVGKTTTCRVAGDVYLDWDSVEHRTVLMAGPDRIAEFSRLSELTERPPVLVFDELHKYGGWKGLLKGFFDLYESRCRVIVTGSSRLDVYRRGGDSLMGRYLPYRMHPFSVAEIARAKIPGDDASLIRPPARIKEEDFQSLWTHGGFPEPFLLRDQSFTRRWRKLRLDQVLREDIRDLTRVQELGQIETLGWLLANRSGEQLVYAHLAEEVRISQDTARRWVEALCSLHFGFLVKPWFRNVAKALRKEHKWFLRDWSAVADEGKRAETLVACHLLKAAEGWTDLGLADVELRYVRDKQKREVDFLLVRDGEPWFLVEVKKSATKLSPGLTYFHEQLGTRHAFQAVWEKDPVNADCFERRDPLVVPARTFLSQLF
jgi:uncharacterized protein